VSLKKLFLLEGKGTLGPSVYMKYITLCDNNIKLGGNTFTGSWKLSCQKLSYESCFQS